MLDPKVFKAYDVRGIHGAELDEEGAHAIGRAYVEVFRPERIAVGRDMRVHAPEMAAAVVRGAAEAGAGVAGIRMVGTGVVFFFVGPPRPGGGIPRAGAAHPKGDTGVENV